MSLEEIKALPVRYVAADSAILLMWCTFPFLDKQIEVLKAWGFRYATLGFVWIKLNSKASRHGFLPPEEKNLVSYGGQYFSTFFGVGYYTKSNPEPCILATRGKVMKPVVNTVSNLIFAPRREHSRKPDEVYEKIEQLYGPIPRLEMFGRPGGARKDDNWTLIGNAMDGEDIGDSLHRLAEWPLPYPPLRYLPAMQENMQLSSGS